ncbi:transforming growth factor beta receptor type 3-like [Denticeps clupeoides]|uniref:transforming growth factor beta receptor type 3-like n=1 Tax=Denticeps clupeoides TaxID=299321 RepID=UPI0010A30441|nr:transforming growth factor beta receptor type 3-like [Denticeps clupeoides]
MSWNNVHEVWLCHVNVDMTNWATRTLFCLLLFGTEHAELGKGAQCPVSPAGALHPVQGFLERYEAGPGCAARERGTKETHVIAVGTASHHAGQKVTVVLRPLSLIGPAHRHLLLVLNSQHAVHWWLEGELLLPGLPVMVQVSPNSTVGSQNVQLQLQLVPRLPWNPQALLRWSLQRHDSITSLTHTARANHVSIRVGEDVTMPEECHLQSLFLSHNYLASDVQPQEVRGCAPAGAGGARGPEVHVIRLWSAGSGLCGSLQVEVTVSLLPPVADGGWHRVVLVLSSAVPVNWALSVPGVRGRITVYASNSVTPLHPQKPDLTMSSVLSSELLTVQDPLRWTNENGFPKVTSYTEADLANRFVVRLAGGRTGHPAAALPLWLQKLRLSGGGDRAVAEAVSVRCHDGRLSVALDRHVLQTLTITVAAATLRDPHCRAQSNGSHFLLAFPVISCGTEGLLEGSSRGVQYQNTVLLWSQEPTGSLKNVTTESRQQDPRSPLAIHIRCVAPAPAAPTSSDGEVGARRDRGPPWAPGSRATPLLTLQLFVTEHYENRPSGPCVITAENRVYVEISAQTSFTGGVEVLWCVVSPLSNPRASPGWPVIASGCSIDPSLILTPAKKAGGDEDAPGAGRAGEDEPSRLRFSFILRPVYNNSIQFLHCGLRQCSFAAQEAKVPRVCQRGVPIPGLGARRAREECEWRNLSRPMLVTSPMVLIGRLPPPAGKVLLEPGVTMPLQPAPFHSGSGLGTGAVLGIVFAAFVMGICLMGALWCIYTCTGPRPRDGGEGVPQDGVDQNTGPGSQTALLGQSSTSV